VELYGCFRAATRELPFMLLNGMRPVL